MIISLTGNIGCGKDTVAKMIQYYYHKKKYESTFNVQYNKCLEFKMTFDEYNKLDWNYSYDSGWQIKKFAYKIKQIAAILVGCKSSDFENEEFKNKELSDEWQIMKTNYLFEPTIKSKRTNRWLLQQLGTEAIRNNIHKETWVNALFSEYKPKDGLPKHINFEGKLIEKELIYPNWIISDLRFLNEAKSVKDRNGIIIKIVRQSQQKEDSHQSELELNNIIQDYTIENNGTIEDLYDKVKHLLDFLIKNNQLGLS